MEEGKSEGELLEGGKERRFIVTPQTELEVIRARQKLAITVGVVVFLLLVSGGSIALILLQKYQQGLAQLPSVHKKPSPSLIQSHRTQPYPQGGIAQVPSRQQELPPSGLLQTPPQQPQPVPTQQLPAQSQKLEIPPGLLDYLEQLKRIEMQRKREASNYWVAFQSLEELVRTMQGMASGGDILEGPEYDPKKILQSYDTYLQRFSMLRQWLYQLSPPIECQQLHQLYDRALLTHINTIESLKQQVFLKNLIGVVAQGLTAQRRIDSALWAADRELASVCRRYGIIKPFNIGDER